MSTLAALAIGRPFPQRKRVEVDASILKRYAGVYRSSKEFTLSVSVEDGRLYIRDGSGRRRESVPHSETGFFHQN